MIEITAENLKYAYKKLKYYVYYYKSLNYLKKTIYDFEQKYENDIKGFTDYFENLEVELNNIKNNTNLASIYKLDYVVYPKKDSIQDRGVGSYSTNNVNLFIKMGLELYLVDVLFALSIYDSYNTLTKDNCVAYGNVYSPQLSVELIKNPLLFENHKKKYKQWKNSIYKNIDGINEEYGLVIKLDMERCFYNFKFDFNDFITKIKVDTKIIYIEKYIYNYYTGILKNVFQKDFNKNECLLPIGIVSSYCILNFYLNNLDNNFYCNSNVINYGRYVDDIMILAKYVPSKSVQTKEEILQKYFADIIGIEKPSHNVDVKEGKWFFKESSLGLKNNIPLNMSKIKCKIVKIEKLKLKQEELSDMYCVSLEDEDRDSCVQLNSDDYNSLKSYFFNNDIPLEKKIEKIDTLENTELLNIYPIWNNLFSFFSDKNKVKKISELIANEINKIVYDGVGEKKEDLTKKIHLTLKEELEVSKGLVLDEKYKEYYISDINQVLKFEYIKACLSKTNEYENKLKYTFPIIISKALIMFYFSTKVNLDENYRNEIAQKYKLINNLDICGMNFDVDACDNGIIRISSQNRIKKIIDKRNEISKEKYDNKVKIAIVNLNIDEEKDFSKYNFTEYEYPVCCSYDIIRKIIDNASKHGAKYILFPELSIPFDEAERVLVLAKENNVSVIFGLTHEFYVIEKGEEQRIRYEDKDKYSCVYARNITVIYDSYVGIVRNYVKQNLSPYEIDLLVKNKVYGVEGNQNKIIINSLVNYAILTCFDATDIKLRASYKDYIDTIFMPVMNKDTEYYSSLIKSLSRDLNIYVVQSNINKYGDSRITGPFHHYDSDIVKTKGGINNYYVLADVDYNPIKKRVEHDYKLYEYYSSIRSIPITDDIVEEFKKKSIEQPGMAKKLSANTDYSKAREIGKIDEDNELF